MVADREARKHGQLQPRIEPGEPSYNIGVASGQFTLENHLGIYQSYELPGCALAFAFVGDEVEIKQVGAGSDCDFGFGVMANHLLTLKQTE